MKIKSYLKHPMLVFLKLSQNKIIRLSDKKHIELEYLKIFDKNIDLKHPKTFNEKLQWLKLYNREKKYINMVDKVEVKKYVSKIIGEKYIIPTINVYNCFEEIDFSKLPNEFVIKCTHDSGGIVVCKDKNKLDLQETRKKINYFLKRDFYYVHREWPYKNVKHRIIIEKYMKDDLQDELIDYKVMCFNGEPKQIFTCNERFSDGLKVTFFDLEWNRLPFERHYPTSSLKIEKPKNLKKMLEFSKQLSKNIPFVRIDWYEINGELFFGEFTFFPGSGLEEFTPEEWDQKLGDWIKLPIDK